MILGASILQLPAIKRRRKWIDVIAVDMIRMLSGLKKKG